MNTTIHLGARTKVLSHKIIKLEAFVNYTIIYFTDGKKLLSSTNLGTLEERLKPNAFFRVNRSELINLQYLSQFKIFSYRQKDLKSTHSDFNHVFLSRRREAAFRACVSASSKKIQL